MILGIDGSNIRGGGGVTHLVGMLGSAAPETSGFTRVRVWSNRATLQRLPDRPWLEKADDPMLEGGLSQRIRWQRRRLPALAGKCAVVLAPGGIVPGRIHPVVTMSRNMLPFEWRELRRYGISRLALRLLLLRLEQGRAFAGADGVIFLTRYAEAQVRRQVRVTAPSRVIAHGLDPGFSMAPRPARPFEALSEAEPLRLVYVSIIDVYKHQWHVARAVARLRRQGLPLRIRFVGPSYGPALRRFQSVLREEDPDGRFLEYVGPVAHEKLREEYQSAEVAVMASSCEALPNVLIEAMGAGMPIACSDRGPMPEVLRDAGTFFDPEVPESIATALESLARDPGLRSKLASRAHEYSARFSWERCARETFDFLSHVARNRAD